MIAADRLKSFIERIERLREEKAAITADEREVFNEAKSIGFDTKAIRKVLQRRAMDPSALDEMDELIDLYEGALGGKGVAAEALRSGASIREAAKAGGVSVGAAAALARVQKTEIIEHPSDTPVQKTQEIEHPESAAGASAREDEEAAPVAPAEREPAAALTAPGTPAAEPLPLVTLDDGTQVVPATHLPPPSTQALIPAFLDRRRAA